MDNFVTVNRVIPILEQGIEEAHYYVQLNGTGGVATGGLKNVSFYTGISVKTLSEISNGRREHVSVNTLDKILTGLNLEYLSHWPEEDGGFSDIYEAMRPARNPIYDQRYRAKRGKRERKVCPRCSGPMDPRSSMCAPCRDEEMRTPKYHCSGCEKEISKKNKSGLCRACWDKNKLTQGSRAEYRKGIRRRLGKNVNEA